MSVSALPSLVTNLLLVTKKNTRKAKICHLEHLNSDSFAQKTVKYRVKVGSGSTLETAKMSAIMEPALQKTS